MKDIGVRIRTDEEGRSIPLAKTDDVEKVIPTLERWGVQHHEWGDVHDFVGQFSVDKDAAYFEVIIITEEEA